MKFETFKRDCTRIINALQYQYNISNEWVCYKDSVLGILGSNIYSNQLSQVQKLRADFEKKFNSRIMDVSDYLICVDSMKENLENIQSLTVPEKVKQLILDEYNNRLKDYDSNNLAKYSLNKVEGVIEIRKCILLWLPLGLYDFHTSGIPKRNLLLCPILQKMPFFWYITISMQGWYPTYEVHLPKLVGKHLTQASVYESYELLASVLEMNPAVKGMYSSAWYHDPKVAEINPRLKYLNELFLKNGGFIHKLSTTESCVTDALLKSKTRQRLCSEGKYTPTNYGRYWSRNGIIKWAAKLERLK